MSECPGRKICATLEILLGHFDVHMSKREGRYCMRAVGNVDEAWDGEGDTLYDAVEMAVDRFAHDMAETQHVSRGPMGSGGP